MEREGLWEMHYSRKDIRIQCVWTLVVAVFRMVLHMPVWIGLRSVWSTIKPLEGRSSLPLTQSAVQVKVNLPHDSKQTHHKLRIRRARKVLTSRKSLDSGSRWLYPYFPSHDDGDTSSGSCDHVTSYVAPDKDDLPENVVYSSPDSGVHGDFSLSSNYSDSATTRGEFEHHWIAIIAIAHEPSLSLYSLSTSMINHIFIIIIGHSNFDNCTVTWPTADLTKHSWLRSKWTQWFQSLQMKARACRQVRLISR